MPRDRDRDRDRDTVPEPIKRADTERLAHEMLAHVREAGNAEPVSPQGRSRRPTMEPRDFIYALAGALREKSAPPVAKTFMGLDRSSWMRIFIAWIVGATLAVAGWYLTVRDGLNAAATHDEVESVVNTAIKRHSRGIHPPARNEIEAVKREQRTIRESQIRQEALDAEQTRILGEIKEDIRRIRRR